MGSGVNTYKAYANAKTAGASCTFSFKEKSGLGYQMLVCAPTNREYSGGTLQHDSYITIVEASRKREVNGLSIGSDATTGVNCAYSAPNEGIAFTLNTSGGCKRASIIAHHKITAMPSSG
jgi:hypothetical protein